MDGGLNVLFSTISWFTEKIMAASGINPLLEKTSVNVDGKIGSSMSNINPLCTLTSSVIAL